MVVCNSFQMAKHGATNSEQRKQTESNEKAAGRGRAGKHGSAHIPGTETAWCHCGGGWCTNLFGNWIWMICDCCLIVCLFVCLAVRDCGESGKIGQIFVQNAHQKGQIADWTIREHAPGWHQTRLCLCWTECHRIGKQNAQNGVATLPERKCRRRSGREQYRKQSTWNLWLQTERNKQIIFFPIRLISSRHHCSHSTIKERALRCVKNKYKHYFLM